MPADRYCRRDAVSPARAKSKSLLASSRASGGNWGRSDGFDGGCDWVGAGSEVCGRPIVVCVVSWRIEVLLSGEYGGCVDER